MSNLYITERHTKCKHWWKLEEKKEKEILYMWLAQIQNFRISYVYNEHGVAFMWCVGQCREKYHTENASWMRAYVFHISFHDYSIYTYKKRTASSFIFLCFLFFWLSLTHPRFLEKKFIQKFKTIISSSFMYTRTYILLLNSF